MISLVPWLESRYQIKRTFMTSKFGVILPCLNPFIHFLKSSRSLLTLILFWQPLPLLRYSNPYSLPYLLYPRLCSNVSPVFGEGREFRWTGESNSEVEIRIESWEGNWNLTNATDPASNLLTK